MIRNGMRRRETLRIVAACGPCDSSMATPLAGGSSTVPFALIFPRGETMFADEGWGWQQGSRDAASHKRCVARSNLGLERFQVVIRGVVGAAGDDDDGFHFLG